MKNILAFLLLMGVIALLVKFSGQIAFVLAFALVIFIGYLQKGNVTNERLVKNRRGFQVGAGIVAALLFVFSANMKIEASREKEAAAVAEQQKQSADAAKKEAEQQEKLVKAKEMAAKWGITPEQYLAADERSYAAWGACQQEARKAVPGSQTNWTPQFGWTTSDGNVIKIHGTDITLDLGRGQKQPVYYNCAYTIATGKAEIESVQ
ncbi:MULTISPECIES: hypothetical protein [Magnetospirillum]|uniref:Uncharacterized protein n=1 Tax=Magnetospirillum aberrantis SpK TaxID=908842 RepID=A0A7C9QVX4_9PROT|nr:MULTISPECIES: hypothetical protein [Magnetospirillum]NFV81904.1 hypothetical protein [Magnetospirillum aberrantis SpK]